MRRVVAATAGVVVLISVMVIGWRGGSVSRAAGVPGFVGLAPGRVLETRSGPGLSTVDGQFAGIGGGLPGRFWLCQWPVGLGCRGMRRRWC
jgi:hypothetical protein